MEVHLEIVVVGYVNVCRFLFYWFSVLSSYFHVRSRSTWYGLPGTQKVHAQEERGYARNTAVRVVVFCLVCLVCLVYLTKERLCVMLCFFLMFWYFSRHRSWNDSTGSSPDVLQHWYYFVSCVIWQCEALQYELQRWWVMRIPERRHVSVFIIMPGGFLSFQIWVWVYLLYLLYLLVV